MIFASQLLGCRRDARQKPTVGSGGGVDVVTCGIGALRRQPRKRSEKSSA